MANLDIFRNSHATQAKQWREAAETSKRQFPDDTRRYLHYNQVAAKFEALARVDCMHREEFPDITSDREPSIPSYRNTTRAVKEF